MKAVDIAIVVYALTGPIIPVGETRTDEERLHNLEVLLSLTQGLIRDIEHASGYADRHEASVRAIGEKAKQFLHSLHSELP